ncbi:MAG TPA: DNA-processing protein DprA [Candidatus Polarisedimenticolia bacterium]|nr:DNA-processing protein DprA [Candidatus Polarisedimenticolia bacterium]
MLQSDLGPARLRAWVTLGLHLNVHPSRKTLLHPGKVLDEGLLDRLERALETGRALQGPWVGDIFSGNFPDWADKQIEACRGERAGILTFEHEGYPARLRHLPDPPAFLYVKGGLQAREAEVVAVVGSRRASGYGLRVARGLGRALAQAGLVVASGLARGIDAAAQRGALDAGGRSLGVLGSGIDIVYPKENAKLFADVAGSGALLTEYPIGTPPQPRYFPERNRIIAALGGAVVVVEAAPDSGSLITARLAADALGLPVAAVPGPITSRTSAGCNDLIYDGATPVRRVEDVIDLLPGAARERATAQLGLRRAGGASGALHDERRAAGLAPEARRLLGALSPEVARGPDELAAAARLASGTLLGHLLELEIKGLAVRRPDGRYLKTT